MVLIALAVSVGACEKAGASGSSVAPGVEPAPEAQPPKTRSAALAAFADSIDPGAQAPLLQGLPAWVMALVGPGSAGPGSVEAMVSATVQALRQGSAVQLLTQPNVLVALARSLAVLEGRLAEGVATDDTLVALATLYAVLDHPQIANERSFFAKVVPAMVQIARTTGGREGVAELEAVSASVFERMQRAGPLRRHALATLLRQAPAHPRVPHLLTAVILSLERDEPQLAVRAAKLAVRFHTPPQATHYADVAQQCYAVLDLACGDDALAQAQRMDTKKALSKRLARLKDVAREHTEVALNNRNAKDFEGRLRYGRAMEGLDRGSEARIVLEALRAQQPKDARVLTGLARIKVARDVDMLGAFELLQAAGELDHKEADYYEISIGVRATSLFATVVPKLGGDKVEAARALRVPLAELRAEVEAYERFGSETAVVLRGLLEVAERALPLVELDDEHALANLLLRSLDTAMALQQRVPHSPHAYYLRMSAAELLRDKGKAVAAVMLEAPSDAPELGLRRAQALINLSITWNDPALLGPAAKVLDELVDPASQAAIKQPLALSAATMLALRAQFNADPRSAKEAADIFYGVFEEFNDANALNNLAVLLVGLGDHVRAGEAFHRAQTLVAADNKIALVNASAFDMSAAGRTGLETVALDEEANSAVRRHAMRWLVHRSKGAAKRRWVRLRAKLLAEDKNPLRTELPNSTQVLLKGRLVFNIGYSSLTGLEFDVDAGSTPWFVLMPPAQ